MRITAEEVTRHPFTIKVVQKYTQRLIKFGCYTEDEREAVEQELMAKVIANWPKFDEAVGHHKSFVCAVVNHASVNMSRRTNDQCRGCRPVSLSSTVNDPHDGLTELAHTIGDDELDRRIARKPRLSATDRIALAHDLGKILKRLTPDQVDLVERLKTQGINAIAADLDVPRTTLSSRLAVIREVFREEGLQEYLNS
jgi:DNA-directed RNA polymerase specialized sigma24 family protein